MKLSKWRILLVASIAVTVVGLAASVSAADRTDDLFKRIRIVYDVVRVWHKDGADVDKFTAGAIRGGLEALGDPYTAHYTAQEYTDFISGLNGSFSGIGAHLEQVGSYVVILSPIKGSPAHRAGVAPGDRILEVNDQSLIGATTEKAVKLIRGPAGTEVTLKMERPSENRTYTIKLVREVINVPEVESKMLDERIGYIQLASFGDDVVTGFYKAVEDLKAQGAKGLVIDLRNNGGGYLNAAIDIASAFVPKDKPVVWEVGKGGTKSSFSSSGKLINLPATVLVDGGSASASEVLAGALQDYGAAPLVGTKTFGKGTVQQILTLVVGGGVKVTVAEYLTPKERHVDKIGLTPDYVVEKPKPSAELTAPMAMEDILTLNSLSVDVLRLQQRLAFLGYSPETKGHYGPQTAEAVRLFSRDHGIATENMVTTEHIRVLNDAVKTRSQNIETEDLQLKKAVEVLNQKLPK